MFTFIRTAVNTNWVLKLEITVCIGPSLSKNMRIIDISFVNLSFYWDIILDNCGISLCEKLCTNNEEDIDEMLAKPQRLVPNSVMMHKTWHGLIPEYVQSWFVSRNDLTLYQLRNSGFSITPHQLLRCFAIEQSFSWTLIKSFLF